MWGVWRTEKLSQCEGSSSLEARRLREIAAIDCERNSLSEGLMKNKGESRGETEERRSLAESRLYRNLIAFKMGVVN